MSEVPRWFVENAPGYWLDEVSGTLRPAVLAYLKGHDMTPAQIATMRAYLLQFIMAPVWAGPDIDNLRRRIDGLTDRDRIEAWLGHALDAGIDPL